MYILFEKSHSMNPRLPNDESCKFWRHVCFSPRPSSQHWASAAPTKSCYEERHANTIKDRKDFYGSFQLLKVPNGFNAKPPSMIANKQSSMSKRMSPMTCTFQKCPDNCHTWLYHLLFVTTSYQQKDLNGPAWSQTCLVIQHGLEGL